MENSKAQPSSAHTSPAKEEKTPTTHKKERPSLLQKCSVKKLTITVALATIIIISYLSYIYQYANHDIKKLEQQITALSLENTELKGEEIPASPVPAPQEDEQDPSPAGEQPATATPAASPAPTASQQRDYQVSSIVAVADLREELQTSKPFVQKMATVAALLKNDPNASVYISVLQPLAERGAPTLGTVQRNFQEIREKLAINAGQLPANPSFIERLAHSFSGVIRIRKVPSKISSPQDTAVIMEQASAALADNNVAEALQLMAAIRDEKSKQAIAPWITEAKLLLKADGAIHNLYSYVSSPTFQEHIPTKGTP